MSFSECWATAVSRSELNRRQQRRAARLTTLIARRPRVGIAVQQWLADRYEQDTGNDLSDSEAIDWSKLLDWLITNLPAILTLLLSLLSLFGLSLTE